MAEDIFDEALRIGHAGRSPPTMAEDMIERAAQHAAAAYISAYPVDQAARRFGDMPRHVAEAVARAALLAALDPEDEALVHCIALAYEQGRSGGNSITAARAVIVTMRDGLAAPRGQGEQSS